MTIQLRFVGGPADGRTVTIADDYPPPRFLVPQERPLSELWVDPLAPPQPSFHTEEYEPLYENGMPRRADDGAVLCRHRPAAVTSDDRRALDEKRREAQADQERRDANLDETWREIREQRPHYPEDWRDL
ncbi:hypothetical protein AB0J38_25935 [Streptomyces sp. NPDC050095]|uniref:hypothetical protein n=1 Tax=unclassified Streptomyces TaxID=2593676 RepID=UPI00343EAA5E